MKYLPEADHQVLCTLITYPSTITQCTVKRGEFGDETANLVYDAIMDLHGQNQVIDLGSLALHLQRTTNRDYYDYLIQIVTNIPPMPSSMTPFESVIRNRALKRRALEITGRLHECTEDDIKNTLDSVIRDLMAMQQGNQRWEISLQESLKGAREAVMARREHDGLPGLTTGLLDIDNALTGLRERELYVIGARSGLGKTALLLNLAIAPDVPVGIISCEQGNEELAERYFSILGCVDSYRVRMGRLREEDVKKINYVIDKSEDKRYYINDNPAITIAELCRQSRQWAYQHHIKALYVDYIQRINTLPGERTLDRVANVVRTLKNLARELSIPVVALSQISRGPEKDGRRPTNADLSDCSEIEKEADCILLMYKPAKTDDDQPDNLVEIIVSKNRHGPRGTEKVIFEDAFMKFRNMAINYYKN